MRVIGRVEATCREMRHDDGAQSSRAMRWYEPQLIELMGMSRRLYDRDGAIDLLLSVARRETLLLSVAAGALDDDAAAIASARLRWAIDAARPLIAAGE